MSRPAPQSSHLSAPDHLAGISQFGGYLTISCDLTPAAVAHSSLILTHAICLAEACRQPDMVLAPSLGDVLHPASPLSLALVAIEAEVALALPVRSDPNERQWQTLLDFLTDPLASVFPPLAVRFAACVAACGSAFTPAPAVRGASASLRATAVFLRLNARSNLVSAATIALLPKSGALFRIEAAAAHLRGQPLSPERISAAAQIAQASAQDALGPTFTSPAFPVHVAAHLVRKALDRAAARALETNLITPPTDD